MLANCIKCPASVELRRERGEIKYRGAFAQLEAMGWRSIEVPPDRYWKCPSCAGIRPVTQVAFS